MSIGHQSLYRCVLCVSPFPLGSCVFRCESNLQEQWKEFEVGKNAILQLEKESEQVRSPGTGSGWWVGHGGS